MEKVAIRRLWAVFSVVLIATLVGCTTNVTPPSGPVGTEICFAPMPTTKYQEGSGDTIIDCGWWVDFQSGLKVVRTYTYEECLPVPEDFSPGKELRVAVTGDTGEGGLKCQWIDYYQLLPGVPGWKLHGYFLVTD
jgi:hypothetical protein